MTTTTSEFPFEREQSRHATNIRNILIAIAHNTPPCVERENEHGNLVCEHLIFFHHIWWQVTSRWEGDSEPEICLLWKESA
jgi:hypothetical protein